MVIPSTLLVLLPPYSVCGIASSIILVLIRLLQGLACGGEMTGAFVHIMETSQDSLGLWAGLTKGTAALGSTLGILAAAVARTLLTEEGVALWGWRACFFLGSVLGILAAYVRRQVFHERLSEEEELLNMQAVDAVITQPSRIHCGKGSVSSTDSAASPSSGHTMNPMLTTTQSRNLVTHASVVHGDEQPAGLIVENFSITGVSQRMPIESSLVTLSISHSNATTESADSSSKMVYTGVLPSAPGLVDDGGDKKYLHSAKLNIYTKSSGQVSTSSKSPLSFVFIHCKTELLVGFLFLMFWGLSFYTVLVWHAYFLTHAELLKKEPMNDSIGWWLIFCSNAALVVLLPLGGLLGDWFQQRHVRYLTEQGEVALLSLCSKTLGNRRAMILAAVCMLLCAPFAYMLLVEATLSSCILAQTMLVLPIGLFGGNLAAVICDLFPQTARYTGVGLSYNVANALVAGTAAYVQTQLVLSGKSAETWTWASTWSSSSAILSKCRASLGSYSACVVKKSLALTGATAFDIMHRLTHDSRMFPAIYLQAISLVAIMSLSIGIQICQHRKQSEHLQALQSHSRTGTTGAVSSAGDESSLRKDVEYVRV